MESVDIICGRLLRGDYPPGWSVALDDRERAVLFRRFRQRKTLAAVGGQLGISRERVRQIEARALRKLASWHS